MNPSPTLNCDQRDERSSVDPRIPLYLVTGRTNRAKTELLERIRQQADAKVALVTTGQETNEGLVRTSFGGTSIDGSDDVVHALYQLHLRRLGLLEPRLAYERIFVEVDEFTETGSFTAVVQNDDRLDVTIRIAGVIHPLDVSEAPFRNSDKQLSRIGEADLVVLVHAGGTEEKSLDHASHAVGSVNPLAKIIGLDEFEVDDVPSWRVAPGRFVQGMDDCRLAQAGMVALPCGVPGIKALAGNLYNDGYRNDAETGTIRSLRLRIPGQINLMAFMQCIRELCLAYGPEVLRLSAVLNARNADYPVAIDIIGGALFHPAYHAQAPRADSDICVVGQGIDIEQVRDALERCRWEMSFDNRELHAAM